MNTSATLSPDQVRQLQDRNPFNPKNILAKAAAAKQAKQEPTIIGRNRISGFIDVDSILDVLRRLASRHGVQLKTNHSRGIIKSHVEYAATGPESKVKAFCNQFTQMVQESA